MATINKFRIQVTFTTLGMSRGKMSTLESKGMSGSLDCTSENSAEEVKAMAEMPGDPFRVWIASEMKRLTRKKIIDLKIISVTSLKQKTV